MSVPRLLRCSLLRRGRVRQTGVVVQVLCPVVVGRRAEVQALESALAGALAARGGCAVITGEAGIGKSRLIGELARMAAEPGGAGGERAGPSLPRPAPRTGR